MARMMARNGARSESRFQRWRFWVAISPGALPQADHEWCAFGAKTTTPKAFRGQSMNQRAYTTSTSILETSDFRNFDRTSASNILGSTPAGM
jgi:hypothetical protein